MTRRGMLLAVGSAAAASWPLESPAAAAAIPNPQGKRGLGATPTGFGARNRANAEATPPVDPIDYYHSLGLGGAEVTGVPPTDPEAIRKLRDKLQSYDMHIVYNIRLPNQESDVPAFDAAVGRAVEVGAYGLHAALTARRYETFDTLEAYRKSFEQNQKQVALAEPVLRRHKIRLAIENHKGWSAQEQAAWLKRLSSEYVGVTLDFGNNVSFCEDPMFTLETLKPWIFAAHLKDMAVAPYEDGFLLSEVICGEGFLDLKKMVQTLRQKDPNIIFDLEMITRDPLKIPIYTDKYWITFEDMPARQLARMMEIVQKKTPSKPLPKITGLSPAERLQFEDDNNLACLRYARQNLGL